MTRRSRGEAIDGWLILDKPKGLGSTAAVGLARRSLNAAKAGHAGTLDPLASGILPIAFGQATKTVPFLQESDKLYRFTLRWGQATTTDDGEGAVIATHSHRPDRQALCAALLGFVGTIWQTPPVYSAIKLNGERSYALARRGCEVTLAPRPVRIEEFSLIREHDCDHAEFEVRCGKGVYVRSLARDLAQKLGTVGHVSELRRCAVGPFTLSHAITLDKLQALRHSPNARNCLFPVQTALDDIPALAIGQAEAEALRKGQTVAFATGLDPECEGERRNAVYLACFGSKAVALVASDAQTIRPMRVFNRQT